MMRTDAVAGERTGPLSMFVAEEDLQSSRYQSYWGSESSENIALSDDPLRPFRCQFCSYHTRQKCNLVMHLRTHTGEKPYQCDRCPFKTAQQHSLKRHKKTHEKIPKNWSYNF